ncbi:MAG: transporter substrate-binding domain-containing protein [Alphaproteobacteria bacterium]|nr:transporter substrate-binding domain-containing protein [Alphaproteobacteria bacterium]
MFKRILVAATAVAACLAVYPAQAQDGSYVMKRIKERGVINMGHREASVPFSYIGKDGKPIGYSVDICLGFIDKIKEAIKMPDLKIKYVPVTSQTRIALMANGTIDLECGSTTNNLTRQKQVDYLAVTFITGTKLGSKKGSGIKEIEDMDGKVIALSLGTTNEKAVKRVMKAKGINIKIVSVKDHPQAWLAVATDRADAYATDDVLLYGLMSKSKDPTKYQVTGRFLSYDPYGIMVPRNDSTYRRLGNVMLADMMRDGRMLKLYKKWFDPGPTNIQMPASATLRKAFEIQALPH